MYQCLLLTYFLWIKLAIILTYIYTLISFAFLLHVPKPVLGSIVTAIQIIHIDFLYTKPSNKHFPFESYARYGCGLCVRREGEVFLLCVNRKNLVKTNTKLSPKYLNLLISMPARTSQTDGDSAVRAEVFLRCPRFASFWLLLKHLDINQVQPFPGPFPVHGTSTHYITSFTVSAIYILP